MCPPVAYVCRFCVFADREAQDSALYLSWKVPSRPTATPAQYLEVMKVRLYSTTCLQTGLLYVCRQIEQHASCCSIPEYVGRA
jgi:hypothetical protein